MFALEIINALNDPDNPAKPSPPNLHIGPARQRVADALNRREGRSTPPARFDITIAHSDTHDGMVTISGFERDPDGSFTMSLDDFREALEADGYELSDAEPF